MTTKAKDFEAVFTEAARRGKFDKTALEPLVIRQGDLQPGEQRFFWHPQFPGFGLKLTPTKAVYVIRGRVAGTGRSVRETIAKYREVTVEQAEDIARERFKKLREGIDTVAEKRGIKIKADEEQRITGITLETMLNDYLSTYAKRLRPKTAYIYTQAIQHCFGDGTIRTKTGKVIRDAVWDSWLDLPITEIDEGMVAERQRLLSSANGPRGTGEAQANQGMRVLRTLFNFAIEHYKDADKNPIITRNPVRALKVRRLWNENVAREDLLTDEQLADWYKAVTSLDNETIRDYLLLLLFSGLRRGEAAKLTWDNIHEKGAKPYLVIPKEDTKTGTEHKLPLSDFLADLFRHRRERTQASKVVSMHSTRFVFPGEKPGSHLIEPKRAIAKVVEKSGVDFSCHTLRRTFGTVAARLDIAHYKHKKLMNHSTKMDVTAQHYLKLSVEDLREPMQKIADHIKQHAAISNAPQSGSVEQA